MSSWAALRGIHAMALPNGRDPRGLLRTAARIQDQYDYFLTPLSLIVLAQAEAHEGSYQAAIVLLQDAALLAAQFQQYEMLAEALQLLAGCATASQRMDLLEPLQRASTWSGNKSGLAHLAGMVGTAELSLAGGNFAQADKLLKQAATIFKGRESGFARYQAQLSFVTAQLAYGQDRAPVGISNLDNALKLLRGNAQAGIMVEPVFQTQMALDLLAGGQLTAQDTEHILQQTLAEPGTAEWEVSPLETLAAITTPRLPAYERLLELAVDRGADDDIVLERMDLVQRQRFYEALPLGGRLFSWRIALGIDPQKLAPEDRRVVEWSLQRFTGAKASAQRIQQLIEQLRQLPPPMDDRGLAPDAKRNFDELDTLASRFENQLAFLSLQRKNLTRFAPSAASPARIQQTLGDSDLAVGFLVTPQRLLGVASTKQEMYFWKQNLSGEISEPLGKLFKGIGLVRPVGGIPPSTVTDPGAAWHGAAQELATLLIPPEVDAMIGRARRLIIVPNGQLWYVPFELLPNAGTATGTPWIAEHEIVYVPTLGSLALAFGPRPVVQHTVGVVGGMFSLDRSANEAQATKLLQAVPASQALFTSQKISTPSMDWLRIATDQLWVANEIDGSGTGWDAVVAPIGASRHLQIGSWLETPRASPDRVLLPGWNAGLSGGSLDSGNEIFLPACALTFSGTRSALLSRWPAKGVSASTFLLRYLEELQQESPAHAMRRAVLSQWSEQFLIADEPNLLPAGKETEALSSGSHPLLWSGYMSIGDYQVPR
jgi:tetratricopeptide (TPR) repeat protein